MRSHWSGKVWLLAAACLLALGLAQGARAENGASEAERLFNEDKFDEARAAAQAELDKDPNSENALYWLGRVAFEKGEHVPSAEYFEKLVAINPNSSDYFLWLGRAHGLRARHSNMLVKGRLAPKIRDAFVKSVELDGSNIDARKGLVQYYAEAPAFLGGDPAKAGEQADAVKKLDEVEGYVAWGNVHFQAKAWDQAQEMFEKAVAGGTEDGPAYASLGDIYRMKGQNDKAREMYNKALEYDNANVEAREGLAKL